MTDATIRYANDPPSALPRGTRLGEFELIKVVGIGGFGIVYEAFDHALERGVAVKEYMPASLAGRTETMHVTLRSQSDAETFALGLKSFINEGRLLARFDLPSLIRVHRFWEANGTAYMAMPLLRGKSVKALRQAMTQPPDEAWLRALLGPLLSTLGHLHAEGVYHRDISPDNIHLEADGRPVLLDLGAARRVIGDATQTLTAILKPAYAPIEQYAEIGGVRQGPWTDLYSLGATLHFLLLGRPPAPATARTISDEQPPLAAQTLPGVSVAFAQVVDWMLSPRPDARPRSVAMVRDAFDGLLSPPVRAVVEPVAPVGWERTQLLPGNTGGRTGTTGTTATKGAQTSQTDVDLSQLTAAAGMTVVPPLPPAPPATARPASTSAPMSVPVAVAPASVPASVPANKSKVWLLGGAAAAAAAVVAVLAFRAGGSAPAPAEAVSAAPPVASAPLQTDGDVRPAAVLTPPLIAAAGPAPAATLPAAGSTSPVAGPTSTAARPPVAQPPGVSPPAVSPPAASPAAANARPLAAPATVAVPAAGDAALPVTRPATAAVRPAATATADTPRAPRPAPGGRPTVLSTPTTEPQGVQAAPGPTPTPTPTPASPDPQRTAPAGPATAPAMALPTLPTLPGTAGAAVQVISGPIERCGRRVLVAQWLCIQKECEKRELRSHPECIKWLKDQDDKSRTQF